MENRPLSAGWLLHIQTLFRNALALCNAAHLKSLKDFDKKVADLCLKQPDKSTNLRTVTTPELLAADRKIWNTISDLLRDGWRLDEALNEMTTVRSDIPSLLQWRPAQRRLPPALEQLLQKPPNRRAKAGGHVGSRIFVSQATRTASGRGMASRRSDGPSSFEKAWTRGLRHRWLSEAICPFLWNQLKALRAAWGLHLNACLSSCWLSWHAHR